MMTADLRAAVVREALQWERTPYHHLASVRGVGVDCAMLLVMVCRAVGLVPADLDPRPYAPDWHLHRGEEKFLGWLEQFGQPVERPQAGDVAVWRFGRTYSHGAIVIDDAGGILHAYKDAGSVVRGSLHETALSQREVRYYQLHGPHAGAV
jgi:cell wall-associated NlpC family hydrolase